MTSVENNLQQLRLFDRAVQGPVPKHQITLPSGRPLTVHRLDRCYMAACGNKGPKLLTRFERLVVNGNQGVVTLGGAFSNHIHAVAALGQAAGVPTVGLIRGLDADLANPTLSDARRWGMRIHRLDRKTYATRYSTAFTAWVESEFPRHAFFPEGGSDKESEYACAALAARLSIVPGNTLVVPVGTGATVRGLRAGLHRNVGLVAANAVGARQARPSVAMAEGTTEVDVSLGGYGRLPESLIAWLSLVWQRTGVLFDPLYNGKAAHWCDQSPNGEMHLLHSGGIQGWRGFAQQGTLDHYPLLKKAIDQIRF